MTDEVSGGRPAVLEWFVRPSLLTYLQRMPDFVVTAEGGGEFTGEAVRLPGVRLGPDAFEASGAVVLSGHGGALTLPLRGVSVADGALWIDDPLGGSARHRLVNLHERAEGGFDTTLAAESDILFLYNYLPDTSFGELLVLEA